MSPVTGDQNLDIQLVTGTRLPTYRRSCYAMALCAVKLAPVSL